MHKITRDDYPFPARERGFDNSYYMAEGNSTGVFIHLQHKEGENFVVMHLYVEGSTREAIRIVKRNLSEFMGMVKALGHKWLCGIRPASDDIEKWVHFYLMALGRDFLVADLKHRGKNYKVISVEVWDGA